MSAKSVSFRSLSKRFGPVSVLVDFDLDVHPGEFLVLLGESGSGKSTALRILAGLESASSGQVLIGDTDVTGAAPRDRDVAMVFQSYALYPHLSVRKNIAYPLKVRRWPSADIDVAVERSASQVQLTTLLDRLPKELSGGQRQRVALARAMVRRPSVFLMDEPLSNLDAKLRGHMRAELKHLQRELGVTTIYVTHDQVEAMTLAHRVALLDKGMLQQLDTPERIYNDPANLFVAGFVGSPPMNLLHGSLNGGLFVHPAFTAHTRTQASAAKAVLGVRPEDCRVESPGGAAESGFDGDCGFTADIYSVELMGDHTLVTVSLGEQRVCMRADKGFRGEGACRVRFAPESALMFDAQSGLRLR